MTDLETREAFLRAIFDSPGDDTPRLVYADWLEERGEEGVAAALRLAAAARHAADPGTAERLRAERDAHLQALGDEAGIAAGLVHGPGGLPIEVAADDLLDEARFRALAVTRWPWWFGADTIRVNAGRITNGFPFDTIFAASATRKVTRLDLSGIHEPIPAIVTDAGGGVLSTEPDYRIHPVITHAGVAALARHRGAHRLTDLDLTYNDLGNDAARALIRSPFLDNLRSLNLMEGNRLLRGRVWQDIIERFGEDVVS